MPYEHIYRGQLGKNFEGSNVIVWISDTTTGQIDPPTFTDIELLSIRRIVSNDSSSKEGIKGVRVEFSFLSTDTENITTFAVGEDYRWLVEVFIENTSNRKFVGWLMADDLSESFLDRGMFEVKVIASDNLGVLKESPFTDFDGSIFKGKKSLAYIAACCFAKTGILLPIRIVHNLFPENFDGATDAMHDLIHIDILTLETDVNKRENCYTTLELIFKGCFITQEDDFYWVVRVDEMNNTPYRYYTFNPDGSFDSAATITRSKEVGIDETIKLINKDATVTTARPMGEVRHNYFYRFPREVICNFDFERGDFNGVISVPGGAAYDIECWTNGKNYTGTPTTVEAAAYIKRLFTDSYETERVVVIPSSTTASHFLMSEPVTLNNKDKFNISVQRRLENNITGSSGTYRDAVMQVRFYGNDTTYWTLAGEDIGTILKGQWVQTNSAFSSNAQTLRYIWNVTQQDETQWHSVNVEADPVPREGTVVFLLLQSSLYGTTNDTEFSNLNLQLIPLINGIYQQLQGQYHEVSTTEELKARIEKEVRLSDSPHPNFKGSMFLALGGGLFELYQGMWYNYLAGPTNELALEKYGKYQAFEEWNQNNRIIRTFNATLLGLNCSTPTNMPGLLHQFSFTAVDDHTDGKYFQILSYSQDLRTCVWSALFADVFDDNDAKDFDSDHEFKYITQ